jgi:pimeloyl-ACP methyl ester carboxylesterase
VYDRRGYGKSPALQGSRSIHYLHEYALQELPQVLAHYIPGQDYVLFGHSDGGSIALIHAAERPPRLRGVLTEAAHVFVEEVSLQGIAAAREAYAQGRLAGLEKYHGDKTAAIFHAWADTWQSPWFRSWDICYLLPSIACPLLALQGAQDQYGSAAQLDAITRLAPHARQQMLEQCGHTPHAEQAEQVIDVAAAFLRELPQ